MATKKPSRPKRSAASRRAKAAPRKTPARRPAIADPGAVFCRAVDVALRRGDTEALSDLQLRRVLTAAVKAYAAKAEMAEREIAPFTEGAVTATEAVMAACAIIRAVDLNLFDVAMWFRRPVAGA
jgi:hypothetical protein